MNGRAFMNAPDENSGGHELVPQILEGEFVSENQTPTLDTDRKVSGWLRSLMARVLAWPWWRRAGAVAAYRVRKAPRDGARLLWFLLRGHGRWIGKGWTWATHGDLRADARAARLIGDPQARRDAQEAIRADGRARWAKLGIGLRRTAIGTAAGLVLLIVLALLEKIVDRSDMPGWLVTVYQVRDFLGAAVLVVLRCLVIVGPIGWAIAAVWEGRDRTPGAGWLTRPDRDDADSWVDERMVSRALAHLGVAPLNSFFKDGGELVYLTPARKDGDGTYVRIRLPLGVTADMVADRRATLAANLGRASLETWPTKADEDGVLDLWIADKGVLQGGAGDWPLLHDGEVDVFAGVPFGLTQRGIVVHAPLVESNWLIGGRPGQGKTSAMRTLLLGAALDPTVELWVFVMGESPDFDPLGPRLSRYRMGMDDAVAADAVAALSALTEEMERRGRVLGEQPGRPPKVSRKLADRAGLGLHPLICAVDECHELFQHKRYGRQAEELAVRLIKRGRKYGIVLLLATQSPTKDSIPKEVTRNISCGVAFAVADHIANDGLLGAGRYRAGIRATELRMKADRGTCVAVGVTDAPWELVRTFYIPYEDGTDQITPVIRRAVALRAQHGPALPAPDRPTLEAPRADPLADIGRVLGDEPRVRTQTVLARLAAHNPTDYEGWTFTDLTAALGEHGVTAIKSRGVMVVRATDIATALADRDDTARESTGEAAETEGVLPPASPDQTPSSDQHKPRQGRQDHDARRNPTTHQNQGSERPHTASLSDQRDDTREAGGPTP